MLQHFIFEVMSMIKYKGRFYVSRVVDLMKTAKVNAYIMYIYSCPMKTHHSSDARICGLSKAVQNFVIYNCYLGQMQCFRTKISIPVTPLTHDVTSASKLR